METFLRRWGMRFASHCIQRTLRPRMILPLRSASCRFLSTSVTAEKLPLSDLESPPTIQLRQYQEECIQAVLDHLVKGDKRLGVSLATGSGKTIIFTQLIGRVPARDNDATQSLVIVHRRELVEQAAKYCRLAYPDMTVEIEMGDNKASGTADITIASIQTLVRNDRIQKFDPSRFKLVLVDESHHIVSPSYRQVLAYFGLDELRKKSPILIGVSATFFRFDGIKLGAAIDHIVYHKDYLDMIGEKWLSDAVFTTVKSEADLSRIRKDRFGDFATGELSKAVNTTVVNSITVRAWLSNASDRKSTLVFCVDTEHVRQLTDTFRDHGIDARYITATTPTTVRNEQLQAFKNREYPVLINCGLFTEGTDIPNVDCVVLARPTRSKSLLIQMIGRGLRLYPGKENCHVIDMVATLHTGVLSTPTLFGLDPDEVLNETSATDAEAMREHTPAPEDSTCLTEGQLSGREDDINVTFTKYDSIFDLLMDEKPDQHIRALSPHAWVRLDTDRYVLAGKHGWVTIDRSGTELEGSYVIQAVQIYSSHDTDDKIHTRPRVVARAPNLEQAVRAADTFASKHFSEIAIGLRQAWRRTPATPAQLKVLNKKRLKDGQILQRDLTKGQANDMITRLKFGSKGRFEAEKKRLKKDQERRMKVEKLRMKQDVKVGPLNDRL